MICLLTGQSSFELGLGWFGDYDGYDLASLSLLSHGPPVRYSVCAWKIFANVGIAIFTWIVLPSQTCGCHCLPHNRLPYYIHSIPTSSTSFPGALCFDIEVLRTCSERRYRHILQHPSIHHGSSCLNLRNHSLHVIQHLLARLHGYILRWHPINHSGAYLLMVSHLPSYNSIGPGREIIHFHACSNDCRC